MATPKFSILIPTRDRPATLRHTLATVLSQPGEDYEVVVADNCGTPETRQLIDQNAHPKLRYTRSEEILPMGCSAAWGGHSGRSVAAFPASRSCRPRRPRSPRQAEKAPWRACGAASPGGRASG